MESIIKTKDSYIMKRRRKENAHPKSIFKIQIYSGIDAEFGEAKSKLGSGKYELLQLVF